MTLIEVKGTQMDSADQRYSHLSQPGIYDDDDCCPCTRHIVRLPNGSLFDLGDAEKTVPQIHIFDEGGKNTGRHVSVDQITIVPTPFSHL